MTQQQLNSKGITVGCTVNHNGKQLKVTDITVGVKMSLKDEEGNVLEVEKMNIHATDGKKKYLLRAV